MPASETNLNRRQLESSAQRATTLWVCLGLALLVVLIYGRVVRYDFVNFDDDVYVYENPHIAQGLTARSVAWAFTSGYSGNWHPVTWISHMVDIEIFGLGRDQDSSIFQGPGGHHLTSVILHLLNTLLLFIVLKAMTDAIWPAAWVAALFAVHPMHVESVAWVSERKDVLCGLFWMLTMLAYVAYTRRRTGLRYILVVAIFAAGLGAKAMLVTLPCVLLLLDFWPLGRLKLGAWSTEHGAALTNPQSAIGVPAPVGHPQFVWLILEKLPLMALAAAGCVVTLIVERSVGTVRPLEVMSLGQRLIHVPTAYLTYIVKMVWPNGLAVRYPLNINELSLWQARLAFLVLAALTVAALRYRNRWPWYLVGWFWFLGTLVPVIGIVQIGEQAYADRYTYLPFIGLFIALAYGLYALLSDWPYWRAVLAMAVVAAFAACAWVQTSYWQNSLTLFSRSLAVTSNDYLAHNNLGFALEKQGRVEESIAHFQEALRIQPNFAKAHNNLGVALGSQQRFEEAIAHYRDALRIKPDFAEAHFNLGLTLTRLRRVDEAVSHYQEAVQIKPNLAEAHFNLGRLLTRLGRVEEALPHYQHVLRIKPDLAEAHHNLGMVLQGLGRPREAVAHYQDALRIQPDHAGVHNNLAWLLATCADAEIRDGLRAVTHAQLAARQAGQYNPSALDTLSAAYAEAGNFQQAVRWQQKAVQMAPEAQKDVLRGRLELYKQGKPFREKPQGRSYREKRQGKSDN